MGGHRYVVVDADAFKSGMRMLAGAVNIITSRHNDEDFGMTATAVCSVTADPPTILVCVNRQQVTHEAVMSSGVFCVNVLSADHWELSATFGGKLSRDLRFKSAQWRQLATGSPALLDALASFDCRVVKTMSHGTHSVLLGQVEALVQGANRTPLIYADGQYRRTAPIVPQDPLESGQAWGY